MRFLCVSDIHGHAARLSAILTAAGEHGFDQLVACGDHLFPGPEPLETWKLLVGHKALCVQGLGDKALATIRPATLRAITPHEQERLTRLTEMHAELGELIVARLGKLPTMARLPLEDGSELVVVHGSPADPTEPFTSDMSDEELGALLGDDPGDLIVCGGSHELFQRQVDYVRIVNVGSVGEAAGGGYATAALIESTPLGTAIREISIEVAD